MSPACDQGLWAAELDDPELARLARAMDSRAYVRELLEQREADFARSLRQVIRMHWCEHADSR